MADERDEQEAAEVLARLAQLFAQMAALPADSPEYRQHAAAQHHQVGTQGGVSDLRRAQAAAQAATPVVPAQVVTPSQQTAQLDINSPQARSILEQVRRAAADAAAQEATETLLSEAGIRPVVDVPLPDPTPQERQARRKRQWRQQVEGTASHQRLEQEGEWDDRDIEAHFEREWSRPRRPTVPTTPGTPPVSGPGFAPSSPPPGGRPPTPPRTGEAPEPPEWRPENDLSQLAAMERNAPPAPRDMARETAETSDPRERTFMQRARLMAQEAGFVKPDYVPEAFQTDQWRQQNAPLSQAERWRFGADMAAVGAFSYLGQKALGGAAQFMSDEGTGRVLGDVQSTAVSGLLGNVATGAMAGFQLGGPKGAAIGAVVGAASTIATLPQKILEWSEALVTSRQRLAMWSGQLQQVGREAQIRGYMRDIQSAQETAPAASTLNQQLQAVLDELRPMKDTLYDFTAHSATFTLVFGRLLMAFLELDWEKGLKIGEEMLNIMIGKDQETRDPTTVQHWADSWRNHVPTGRVRR